TRVEPYTQDEWGRISQTPAGTFDYGSFDLPRKFTAASGAGTLAFKYDVFGARIVRTGSSGGADEVISIGKLYQRRKAGSAVTHVFRIWAEDRPVIEITDSISANRAYTTTPLFTDSLGTVAGWANEKGDTFRAARRDPFGVAIPGVTPYLGSDIAGA